MTIHDREGIVELGADQTGEGEEASLFLSTLRRKEKGKGERQERKKQKKPQC